MYDAIIISDIHLGSDACQAKSLADFLELIDNKSIETKELILNGDVFDSWDFRRLKKSHWKVLSKLRKLSDDIHIVWINGNHDGPAEIVSHLIGVEVAEEYIFESANSNILTLHGHIFDNFITDHPILTYIADFFYNIMQWIDPSFYLAKFAKRSSKTFLRCSEIIRQKATHYAETLECDFVCCGHTHLAQVVPGKVCYYNSGCWTEQPATYLTVENGEIKLNTYENKHEDNICDGCVGTAS